MTYYLVIDYHKRVDCLDYADMQFKAFDYRTQGCYVEEIRKGEMR